jgi:hypothetical protein
LSTVHRPTSRARAAGEARRTRAIVIYPMKALANSQMKELERFIDQSGLPEMRDEAHSAAWKNGYWLARGVDGGWLHRQRPRLPAQSGSRASRSAVH